MQRVFLFLLNLFPCLISFGQSTGNYINSDYFSNLIPKTGQASSLGNFGNIPINYYAGQPEISLPLMTLTSRDLSLPISINYDASGVKTDDMSGPVGLKWNLNAGGFIARDMNGLPDEHPDKGYLKYAALSDYWNDISSISDWVERSEKNTSDCHPDEFVININGRSIRFIFDKYGKATTIPRQNVKISYTKSNSKIHKFLVTTEDGTVYEFGGEDTAIEQRKIERLVTKFAFRWDPTVEMANNAGFRYYFTGYEYFSSGSYDNDEKADIDWYNSKWYLKSITSPSSDQILFTYQKGTDVKYASKPNVVRVTPILVRLGLYHTEYTHCGCGELFGWCPCGEEDFEWYHPGPANESPGALSPIENSRHLLAIREFKRTYPGTPPASIPLSSLEQVWSTYPSLPYFSNIWFLKQSEDDHYLHPESHGPNPGGVSVTSILVTESNIRLESISSLSGNHIQFSSSTRSDLPNSYKHDRLYLYNLSNQLIKNIKLEYSTINADESGNDLFWLSEALAMSKLSSFIQPDAIYYAHYAKTYSESSVTNSLLRKFVFEGLKDYNYKRLFLDAVIEEMGGQRHALYRFEYEDRHLLRRKTTPAFDARGFTVTNPSIESFSIGSGKTARMSKGYNQLYGSSSTVVTTMGILNRISYPTKGSTAFVYEKGLFGPRIKRIEDRDENGNSLKQAEVKYITTEPNRTYNYETFQEFKLDGEEKYIKYRVTSTSPQNDWPELGPIEANTHVRVFNGTEANHRGYEEFKFVKSTDPGYGNSLTAIYSSPKDKKEINGSYEEVESVTNTNVYPFPRPHNRQHLRGVLKEHIVYSGTYSVDNQRIVRKVENFYEINPLGYVPITVQGFTGGSYVWSSSVNSHWYGGYSIDQTYKRRHGKYKISADWLVLDKSIETVYDLDNQLQNFSTVKEFEYDVTNLQLLTTTTYNAALPTQKLITKAKYPTHPSYQFTPSYPMNCAESYANCQQTCANEPDPQVQAYCYTDCDTYYGSGCEDSPGYSGSDDSLAIIQLKNKHQISDPIEVQTLIDENETLKLISASVYTYSKVGLTNVVRQKSVHGLKRVLDPQNFQSSSVDATTGDFNMDNRLRLLHTFDLYDQTNGNLLQQTSLDGITSRYQWGYNNSLVTGFILNPGGLEHVYSYDHKPLVGVSSSTDPNGRKSFYDFDSFSRLKLTKDHDGNILTRYRYHYKTDNVLSDQMSGSNMGITGQQLSFSSPDYLPMGVTTYSWNFGDGTPSAGGSYVNHTYSSPGSFVITLTKTNPEYGSITITKTVTITPQGTLIILSEGSTAIDLCYSYQPPIFYASVLGGCVEYSYVWEYRTLQNSYWTYYAEGSQAGSPPVYGEGDFEIRCIAYGNPCNDQITSESVYLTYYRSNPNCYVLQEQN